MHEYVEEVKGAEEAPEPAAILAAPEHFVTATIRLTLEPNDYQVDVRSANAFSRTIHQPHVLDRCYGLWLNWYSPSSAAHSPVANPPSFPQENFSGDHYKLSVTKLAAQ